MLQWDTYYDLEHPDDDLNIDKDAVYDIEFPVLKRLRIDNAGWWIPRNAPMLEELDITASTIAIKADVLDTIPHNLQKLVMRLLRRLNNKACIIRYLNDLAQQSKLKDFTIHFRSSDDAMAVIDTICHLHQLEHLDISIADNWDSHHMEASLDKITRECPLLTSLDIISANTPSIQSMNILKRLEHLKGLAFLIMGSDEGFWNVIQSFSQLASIRIYSSILLNNDPIRHLKKQRPDMKISHSLLYS